MCFTVILSSKNIKLGMFIASNSMFQETHKSIKSFETGTNIIYKLRKVWKDFISNCPKFWSTFFANITPTYQLENKFVILLSKFIILLLEINIFFITFLSLPKKLQSNVLIFFTRFLFNICYHHTWRDYRPLY